MWYKQVLAQVGGGVSFSGEKPADSIDSNNHQKIDGGLIFVSDNQYEFNIITYDVTKGNKSDKMIKTVREIQNLVYSEFYKKLRLIFDQLNIKRQFRVNFISN